MSTRLYTLALSHPGLASQLALQRKGVEHDVVELLPGMHPLALRALGFEAGTVPALRSDGRRIQGSLEIARFLEDARPDPPLFPGDEGRRRAVEDAERWGEAVLQPIPRRLFRFIATRSHAVRRWTAADVVGMPAPEAFAAANKPVAWVMGRKVGATADRVRADIEGLGALLNRVEELIDEGVIGSGELNAADLQILTSIRSLQAFTDLVPLLSGRRAGELARRVIPALPGPVPAALPRQWVDRAQATA